MPQFTIHCRDKVFTGVQAVLLDKDGTLEDSQSYLWRLARQRAQVLDRLVPGVGENLTRAFGVGTSRIDPAGLMGVGSRGESATAAAAYIAATGRDWMAAKNLVAAAFAEADRQVPNDRPGDLLPGSWELLQALHRRGCGAGILSNAPSKDVANFVGYHGLEPYLHMYMGADGAVVKPDPTLFWQACDRLGLPPEAVLMVGDSAADVALAHRAGAIGCVAIAWGEAAPHLAKADVVIDQLTEIYLEP